jgi:hypothetical protein
MIVTVGNLGASLVGGYQAAVTPAWGTGENRTAGNLLLCWASVYGSATLPTTPTGWSIGSQKAGTSVSATVFYRVATGADAAPTLAAISPGGVYECRIGEFTANTASPFDKAGSASGTTSPIVATCSAADSQIGNLIVSCATAWYSASTTATLSDTYSNLVGNTNDLSTTGTSTSNHYSWGYGSQASNASATKDSWSYTVTNITGAALAIATFKASPNVKVSTLSDTFASDDIGTVWGASY